MNFVIDTHPVIWYLENNPKLSQVAREIMDSEESTLIFPTITLAEISYLYQKDRVTIDVGDVLEHINQDERFVLIPFDELILRRLPKELDIHDGIIVATTLVSREDWGEETALITKDREIIESGLVETLW